MEQEIAKSLKEKEMTEIEVRNKRSASYGEGYADGFSDGYDKAIENVLKLADKYAYGKKENEEVELKPAVYFLHQPLGKLMVKSLFTPLIFVTTSVKLPLVAILRVL